MKYRLGGMMRNINIDCPFFRTLFLCLISANIFCSMGLAVGKDVLSSDGSSDSLVIVHVSTNSENQGFEAFKAFDGNRTSFWHSKFSSSSFEWSPIPVSCGYGYGCVDQHPKRKASREFDKDRPFELRIDLCDVYELKGFRYWPRCDGNTNGVVDEYELYAFASIENERVNNEIDFIENGDWILEDATPVVSGNFSDTYENFSEGRLVSFSKPILARYLVFRVKSELHNRPYASVAELEFLSDKLVFRSSPSKSTRLLSNLNTAQSVSEEKGLSWIGDLLRGSSAKDSEFLNRLNKSAYFKDLIQQYNRLVFELGRSDYYEAIASQLPSEQAGILSTDRDPCDIVFRRTRALFLDLNEINDETLDNIVLNSPKAIRLDLEIFSRSRRLLDRISVNDVQTRFKFYIILALWRRSLLFQRSELDFDKLLFVKRNRSDYNHLCDQFYGRSAVPGGGLYRLENIYGNVCSFDKSQFLIALEHLDQSVNSDTSLLKEWEKIYSPVDKDLLENSFVSNDSRLKGKRLVNGAFIAPELSFDGKEIAFAFCECNGSTEHISTLELDRGHTQEGRCYHLFKCDSDGENLQMISDGTWNDFDPCFLPNGRLAFITERRNGYLRCGRDCPNYTLFEMNPDGTKIRCLSRHETNEWAPSVSNNGQILWTRWDYIDRFGCIAHGPWITSPDGRNPRAICGNYTPRHFRPDSILDIRAIPGSSKLIATAGPHHGQSFGTIVEIDPNAPDDPFSPIICMTPEVGFPESQNGFEVWGTPWPLAEDLFLAVADYSFDPNSGEEKNELGNYGIYLVDGFGNRELIYRDFEIGSSTPIPFVARETPPVIPSLVSLDKIIDEPYVSPPAFDEPRQQGIVTIQNVYNSDRPLPENVKIVAIRVVQVFCMSVPSGYPPYETGIREATATDSVKLARRVWGIAPVEEDGSANFYVPANCEIYFQALDENGVAIRSMRSGTALQPNENLSCVGCHELREAAGVDSRNVMSDSNGDSQVPLALRRAPSVLASEGVGTQPLNFPELVQPALDKYCIKCHNQETEKNGIIDLSRTPKNGFYASYWNLVNGGFASNNFDDSLRTPMIFGARSSQLYELLHNHYDVSLSNVDQRRIALWLDNNTMFYGVYEKEGCEKEFRGERATPSLE